MSTTQGYPQSLDFDSLQSMFVSGYFAFRRPTDGSWFIQALCSVLEKSDGTHDVLQLLTRVVNIVAQEYVSRVPLNPAIDNKKQTPCIYSMLTKDLHWKVREQPGKILTWP